MTKREYVTGLPHVASALASVQAAYGEVVEMRKRAHGRSRACTDLLGDSVREAEREWRRRVSDYEAMVEAEMAHASQKDPA